MDQFARYLHDHNVRQVDFAERLGVGQATVSRLASGTMTPSLRLAVAIERATDGAVPASTWVNAANETGATT